MIKKTFGSRKALRFISLLCVITFGLMTIVGTGGGGGGNGQPETTPDPGTVEKTANVNTSEIGGTELNVLSVYVQTGSVVVNGSFSTLVSTVGTQLLFIADQENNLRGMTLSTIDAVTNQANILDADATSTALSILMLTPGITTVDPTETQTRISELQNLEYFQNLVDFLRTDLLNRTLPDVLGDEEFNTILEGCVNEWLNTYSSGSTQNLFGRQPASIGIDPTKASFNISLKDDSDMENVLLTMSNFGWRFVNVFRRDLDMSSNEIQVLTLFDGLFESMDGAVPISWGSLFTNTIGDPEIADDPYPVDLSSSSDIQKVQYWVVGPGSASSSDSLPPSLDTVDDASALIDVYGTTLIRYFVFPILDIITGTSSILTDSAKWSKAREVWSGIKGGLSLYGLIQADDEASAIRELINISASLFSILITSGVLVSAGIISAKAGIVIGIVLGASAIIMGAGNLILVVKDIFSYPRVSALEVTNIIDIGCFSSHFASGHYVQLYALDPTHDADSITVTGPGLDTPFSLTFEAYRPDEWWSVPNVFLGVVPEQSPPLTYFFDIESNADVYTLNCIVDSLVEEFATDLSPSGGEIVSRDFTFSWTGIGLAGATYQVQLDDASGQRIWDSEITTENSIPYTGLALSSGSTYRYYVVAIDTYGNQSLAQEWFVYE